MSAPMAMACLLQVCTASIAATGRQDRVLVVDVLREAGLSAQQLESAAFYAAQADALYSMACMAQGVAAH